MLLRLPISIDYIISFLYRSYWSYAESKYLNYITVANFFEELVRDGKRSTM